MKILILCTGNSCRSQMAEAFLAGFDARLEVRSAGSKPAERVNPWAVRVMREVGVDLSAAKAQDVREFLDQHWDYVVTVCGNAQRDCPAFLGQVDHRVHLGFDDPADATGTDDEILAVFRASRDEIQAGFRDWFDAELAPRLERTRLQRT